MAYGQIRSSSGRVMNLSPEGWINNEGENLNALNGIVGQSPPGNLLKQLVELDYASPKVQLANGVTGYRGKGVNAKNLYDAEGNLVEANFMPGEAEKDRERQRFDAEMKLAASKAKLLDAQAAQAGMGGKSAPVGYRYTADGKGMEVIPGGPADLKAQALDANKAAGAADVDLAVGTLRDAYDRLDQGGGITNTNKGTLDNIVAGASSSAPGQMVGKMLGTKNQSARNEIEMTRPALLAALMKATGMSAKQMDSNAELKLWMRTATDPTLDVQANRAALSKIEQKYLRGVQPQQQGGAQIISEARNAIMGGAPREAVIQRLESMGITNHGL